MLLPDHYVLQLFKKGVNEEGDTSLTIDSQYAKIAPGGKHEYDFKEIIREAGDGNYYVKVI